MIYYDIYIYIYIYIYIFLSVRTYYYYIMTYIYIIYKNTCGDVNDTAEILILGYINIRKYLQSIGVLTRFHEIFIILCV